MKKYKGVVIKAVPRELFIDALVRGYVFRLKAPRYLKRKFIKKNEVMR